MGISLDRKHPHPSNLRVASGALPFIRDEEIRSLDPLFYSLRNGPINICMPLCPCYSKRNDRCETLGIMAPLGEGCRAQVISRETVR